MRKWTTKSLSITKPIWYRTFAYVAAQNGKLTIYAQVRELQTFVGLKKLAISEMNRVRAENTSAVVQNPFDIERPKVEEFMPKCESLF